MKKAVLVLTTVLLLTGGCATLSKIGLHVLGHAASDCLKRSLEEDEKTDEREPVDNPRPADGSD
jgi:hypothetical protein